jgi:two-component system, NtrC family, response regulator HydG
MKPSNEAVFLEVDPGRCLVSASGAMRRVHALIERLAPTDTTVLITGETGTGKELVARLIHKLSPRGGRRMVAEDCNAVSPTLFESELFGHERGAFTGAERVHVGLFEAADGTTLFLDEIANLSLDVQARLLRVLQEREFRRVGGQHVIRSNFRLITATNSELSARVRAGTFRGDLLHRLLVARIDLPPLRERRADIPLLVTYFVEKKRIRLNRPAVCRVSHAAMDALTCYDWPGNVRELENVVESAILDCSGDTIDVDDLVFVTTPPVADAGDDEPPFRIARRGALAEFERRYLVRQLRRHAGNVAQTARDAGITSKHIRSLMRRHGIERRSFRRPARLRAPTGRDTG